MVDVDVRRIRCWCVFELAAPNFALDHEHNLLLALHRYIKVYLRT